MFEIGGPIRRASHTEADAEVFLEVLPYTLSALIAAIVVPGFLMSQFHGNQLAGASNSADRRIRALKLVHEDDIPFAPSSSRSSRVGHQPVAK
jgi:hypothetical protein